MMGSKGLKFVAIDAGKAPARQPAERRALTAACKQWTKAYRDGEMLGWMFGKRRGGEEGE